MDQEFQTSFIPKKPIQEKKPGKVSKRAPGALNVVAVVIFFASILGAAGAFVYQGSLVKKIDQMQESLNRAKDLFEPSVITTIQDLDKRIKAAEEILQNHIAVSPIFVDLLEPWTLPEIRYTNFSYEIGEGEEANLIAVDMSGEAKDYEHIAFQADLFGEDKYIKNPIFSSFSTNKEGYVEFDLTFSVDRSLVSFQNKIYLEQIQN